jgi:hypothetical protein
LTLEPGFFLLDFSNDNFFKSCSIAAVKIGHVMLAVHLIDITPGYLSKAKT